MSEEPEETALYRIYDDEGLLLYIGISKDFGSRWKHHARVQPWWGDVRRQTIYWHDSRPEAEAAEVAAIEAENPKYNIAHSVNPPSLPRVLVPVAPVVPRRLTAPEVPDLPTAMDVPFAADLLGIPRRHALQLARAGRFPCAIRNYGGYLRVRLVDILPSLGLGMDGKPLAADPPQDHAGAA